MTDERRRTDDDLGALEDRLRRAMSAQADRFEPSEDSYLRLRREVHDVDPGRLGGPVARRLAPRILAAAAAIVVAVGGALALQGDDAQRLDVTPATTPTTEAPAPTTSTTVEDRPASTTTTAPAVVYPELEASAITGPRKATVEDAVVGFLELVRLDGVDARVEGAAAFLGPSGDDGDGIGTAFVAEVPLHDGSGSGYTVAWVESVDLAIDSFDVSARIDAPAVEVSGIAGDGVDSVDVALFSNHDGIVLGRASAQPDDGGRYGTEVALTGTDSGWIVVTARNEAGEAVGLVARPLQWSTADPFTYTVSFVPPDDPDGGLNLRNVPGVDEGEVLGVLSPGAQGIRRRGTVPSLVDGTTWWAIEVTTAEGERLDGWVLSRHLVIDASPTEEQVAELAARLTSTPPEQWPWSPRVILGRPTALAEIDTPADRLGGQLGDLVGGIDPTDPWTTQSPALSDDTATQLSDWWFPGLTPLTFVSSDGTERTTLYLESTSEGLLIAGVVGWDA